MDDAFQIKQPGISTDEMERRRKMVWRAFRSNVVEGASQGADVEPIFDAFIRGEIEAGDIVPQISRLWKLDRHSPTHF
ncbi:MAG: hypothetical protein FWD68_18690 [Alphaproteobacteria bacterium]|nr:hypothetical protein [Alphaproteobacteria bacterium]